MIVAPGWRLARPGSGESLAGEAEGQCVYLQP